MHIGTSTSIQSFAENIYECVNEDNHLDSCVCDGSQLLEVTLSEAVQECTLDATVINLVAYVNEEPPILRGTFR